MTQKCGCAGRPFLALHAANRYPGSNEMTRRRRTRQQGEFVSVRVDRETYERLSRYAELSERTVPRTIRVLTLNARIEDLAVPKSAEEASVEAPQ